jgi:Zn ribbon nucleic-acid-binding protein
MKTLTETLETKKHEIVEAETEGHVSNDRLIGDIVAECPNCKVADAFVSTGEHALNGSDNVTCPHCGYEFKIKWNH